MTRKTAEIKAMVLPDVKRNLNKKAKDLGLTLTAFIEKVANEPIVFMDSNVKNLIDTMGKIFPNHT